MGYQPALDGIRAIAVAAVLLYHADFRWIPGGFLGVDVFFVVSGYLITSLLLEERRGTMTTDLKHFWLRRAKRLLPALFAMLIVTCTYAALFVPDALYRLRRDALAALTYSTNWWLIASHQSYFDALGRPPLLRHLWSLAVEEQWYLLATGLRDGHGSRPRPRRATGAPRARRGHRVRGLDGDGLRPGHRRISRLLRHRHPDLGAAPRGGGGDGLVAVAVA
jgi:hypothetical protein